MKIHLILFVIQLLEIKNSIQDDQLKVSIYYESLCPDSIRFIKNQLYPAYQKIGSSLLLDFVPYGKATHEKINGTWKFDCQHGPNECWGNKAQACGLAEHKGQDKDVEFVHCVMSQPNPAAENIIATCAPKLEVASDTVLRCSEDEKGNELLVKLGDQTHAVDPLITFIPTIVFNDKFDADVQSGSLTDFLDTVCRNLSNKPSACPEGRI